MIISNVCKNVIISTDENIFESQALIWNMLTENTIKFFILRSESSFDENLKILKQKYGF